MSVSYWQSALGPAAAYPALPGDLTVDVAIAGGGYTGFWTAYYLSQLDPTLSIAVLEASQVGFGASGRNGGWCSGLFPVPLPALARRYGHDAAVAMYDVLGCSGVARIDFFMTEAGPVLNEVNTIPGMTEHSQVPQMFAAAGLPYAYLLDELVRGAHW